MWDHTNSHIALDFCVVILVKYSIIDFVLTKNRLYSFLKIKEYKYGMIPYHVILKNA